MKNQLCEFYEVAPGVWKSRDRLEWGDAAKDAEIAKGNAKALWERDAEGWLAETYFSSKYVFRPLDGVDVEMISYEKAKRVAAAGHYAVGTFEMPISEDGYDMPFLRMALMSWRNVKLQPKFCRKGLSMDGG